MSNEKPIFPKGITCFKKSDTAPDFVIGTMIISIDEFADWLASNQEHITDYKGKKQIKLKMTYTRDEHRPSVSVDTYKSEKDDLPF